MTDISSTSSEELTERRRQLRRKRRGRFLQTSWQILSMAGLTLGIVWAVTLPDWMLHDASQVVIQGNRSLSSDAIRAKLPIHYPESVLAIQPEALAHALKTEAPIAEATVSRRMFPPGIIVRIQERQPIATVYANPSSSLTLPSSKGMEDLFVIALLDAQGTWMPYEQFSSFNQSPKLPSLKVVGIQEQYQTQWVNLYQAISQSPVKVTAIDWREPSNLILQTEIGRVHFGPFSARFPEQLKVLDRMRELPDNIEANKVAYIDLSNPEMPMLELTPGAAKSAKSSEAEER